MTERQIRNEIEKNRYNEALKTKEVRYLGCTISYKNPHGYAYFSVKTPWENHWIESEIFKTITKAKETIKRVHEKKRGEK